MIQLKKIKVFVSKIIYGQNWTILNILIELERLKIKFYENLKLDWI